MATYLEEQKQTELEAQQGLQAQQDQLTSKDSNPFGTANGQMFAQYYQGRHDPNGHLYTADQDGLSITQRREMANYEARRTREENMRNQGVNEADIALFRKWDQDIHEANISGKQLDYGKMFSADYSASAKQEYEFDESMYSRYVAAARHLSKEEYDPDGDGHYNMTEDLLKEFKDYNDDELANTYDWMTEEQKRMLDFDGISDRNKFVEYTRRKIKDYDDAHSGFWYNIGQFFKGIGSGFISGIMDIVKLPTTLIGLAGALVTWKWDNPLSKAMFEANKAIDENTTGAYNKAVGLDSSNTFAKVGGWVGQAAEMAVEVIGTGGLALAWKAGEKAMMKAGEKLVEKAAEKTVEKVGEKTAEKVTSKLGEGLIQRQGAKLIEKEAFGLAQKAGTKVTEEHIMEAAAKIGGKAIGTEAGEKALERAVSVATVRLARRGAYDVTEKTAAKLIEKGAEKAGEKTVEKTAAKGIERVTAGVSDKMAEKASEKGAEVATKEVAKETLKKQAQTIGNTIVGKLKSKAGGRAVLLNRTLRKGTQEHIITSLAGKPTVIGRALRKTFGKTDPLTKLFAMKSFAHSVQNSQARGDNPYAAFGRAMLAYGTTNFIWGKMSPATGSNAVKKMFEKNLGKVADKTAVSSKLVGSIMQNAGHILWTSAKMFADGTLQDFINQGLRRDADGKFHVGLMEAFKNNTTIDKLSETFLSTFTMHMTGAAYRGVKLGAYKVQTSLRSRETHINTMNYLDQRMSSDDAGIGGSIWSQYKDAASKKLGAGAESWEIIDEAATQARAAGGAVGDLVDKLYIQASAWRFGQDFRQNLENIASEVDETVKDINARTKELVVGSHEDNDVFKDLDFRLFVEHAAMDNANLFNGEEIPSDVKVNNWQPEDFPVSYALFQGNGLDLKTMKDDVQKPIRDAFEKAGELKKQLKPENFKELLTLKFSDIKKVAEAMKDPMLAKPTRQYISFRSEMKKALKLEGEARTTAIDDAVKKYQMTMDAIKAKEAAGIFASQQDQKVVEDSWTRISRELKESINDPVKLETKIKEILSGFINKESTTSENVIVDWDSFIKQLDEMKSKKQLTEWEHNLAFAEAYDQIVGDSRLSKKYREEFAKKYETKVDIIKVVKEDTISKVEKAINDAKDIVKRINPEEVKAGKYLQTEADINSRTKYAKSEIDKMQKIQEKSGLDQKSFDDLWSEITGKSTKDNLAKLREDLNNVVEDAKSSLPGKMSPMEALKIEEVKTLQELNKTYNNIEKSIENLIKSKGKNISESENNSTSLLIEENKRLKSKLDEIQKSQSELKDEQIKSLQDQINSLNERVDKAQKSHDIVNDSKLTLKDDQNALIVSERQVQENSEIMDLKPIDELPVIDVEVIEAKETEQPKEVLMLEYKQPTKKEINYTKINDEEAESESLRNRQKQQLSKMKKEYNISLNEKLDEIKRTQNQIDYYKNTIEELQNQRKEIEDKTNDQIQLDKIDEKIKDAKEKMDIISDGLYVKNLSLDKFKRDNNPYGLKYTDVKVEEETIYKKYDSVDEINKIKETKIEEGKQMKKAFDALKDLFACGK